MGAFCTQARKALSCRTRKEFEEWSKGAAAKYGYTVKFWGAGKAMHEARALTALGVLGQDLGFASQVHGCSLACAIHQLFSSGRAPPFWHHAVILMGQHVDSILIWNFLILCASYPICKLVPRHQNSRASSDPMSTISAFPRLCMPECVFVSLCLLPCVPHAAYTTLLTHPLCNHRSMVFHLRLVVVWCHDIKSGVPDYSKARAKNH